MEMNRILLIAAALFVVFTRPAVAQKVGDIVVVIKKDATLMDSDKVVLRPGRGITLTVRQVKDRWFLVSRLGRRGWIHGDHIAKPNDAIKVFTAAIRRKPSSEIYNARGMIWQHKGEYDIAIKDYNEAIRINPESSSAYNNRGNCYLIKKKYDKAIADYGEALRISPKSAVTLNNRAIAWEPRQIK